MLLLPISLAGFAWSLYLSISYVRESNRVIDVAYKQAEQTTRQTAERLDHFVSLLEKISTELAQKLSAGSMDNAAIEAELKKKPVEVSGFGVAFAPDKKKYAPYYIEKNGVQTLVQLENLPDYTYYNEEWFTKPLKGNGMGYGPFSDHVSNNDVIEYAVPFYDTNDVTADKKPIGIVYATMTMEHLQHILTTLFFGQRGYWFLVADNGIILTHPSKKMLYSRTTMADLAKAMKLPEFDQLWQKTMQDKKPSFMTYKNEIDGDESWLFCEAIPARAVAVLCGVFIKEEIPVDADVKRDSFIRIVCVLLVSILFLLLFFLTRLTWTYRFLWLISGLVSLALGLSIAAIWSITDRYPRYGSLMTPIIDKVNLYQYLNSEENPYASEAEKEERRQATVDPLAIHYKQNDYVPTGIFIRYIRLVGDTQVQVTGYIWQRYHEKYHKDLSRGFILPQSTGDVRVVKMYDTKLGEETVVIWRIMATLNQDITYSRYPFDFKSLEIKLWHNDFENNVILIPDFNAYTLTNPTTLPGLHPEARVPGWNVLKSYFGYTKSTYKTSFGLYRKGPFGIAERTSKEDTPELHFNIAISRLLTDTLISDLVPLAVIILLLFIMILLAPELGTSILSGAASLFFGAIFAQIRFRSKLPAYGVVYFEYFYFIVYFALFVIICLNMVEKMHANSTEDFYKRNMISSLLFWPVVLMMALAVTVVYLY
jgi:hypothetical protein